MNDGATKIVWTNAAGRHSSRTLRTKKHIRLCLNIARLYGRKGNTVTIVTPDGSWTGMG